MKNILLKILKIIGKILLRIIKIVFLLPFSAYMLGKTYDINKFEKDIEELQK